MYISLAKFVNQCYSIFKYELEVSMTRKYQQQGGWIVSFVVVGAILALGVLAGLYYLKNQSSDGSTKEVSTNEQKPASDSKDDKPQSEDKKPETSKETTTGTPSQAGQTEKSSPGSTKVFDGTSSSTNTKDDSSETKVAGDLPKTGPEDVLGQLAGVSLLTVAVTAYIQSRRHL